MDTEKAIAAVRKLREYDHVFMSEKGVKDFNAALGVNVKAYTARANPRDPKGLTFSDGAKSGRGCDAAVYAVNACDQLGLTAPEKYGRGSQLAAACDTLAVHFAAAKFADEKTASASLSRGTE